MSNGKQRVLDQGTLTVSLVDRPVTPVPRAPRPAPAPPSLSPLGAGLALGEGPSVAAAGAGTVNVVYPEIYRPPSTASDAGSEGSGGQEGAAAAAVVFAVGSTAWEVLPASQTLKVGPPGMDMSSRALDGAFDLRPACCWRAAGCDAMAPSNPPPPTPVLSRPGGRTYVRHDHR